MELMVLDTLDDSLFCLSTPNLICKFDIANPDRPQFVSHRQIGSKPGMSLKICARKRRLYILSSERRLFVVSCDDLTILDKFQDCNGIYNSCSFTVSVSGDLVWTNCRSKPVYFLKFFSVSKRKITCLSAHKPGRVKMVHCAQRSNRLVYVCNDFCLITIQVHSAKRVSHAVVSDRQMSTCCELPKAYTLFLGGDYSQVQIVDIQTKTRVLKRLDYSEYSLSLSANLSRGMIAFGGSKSLVTVYSIEVGQSSQPDESREESYSLDQADKK